MGHDQDRVRDVPRVTTRTTDTATMPLATAPVLKTSVTTDPDRPGCITVTVSGATQQVIAELPRIAGLIPQHVTATAMDRP